LLLEHSALGCGQAAPAIFTRPFRHCPAALRHHLKPAALVVRLECPIAPAPTDVRFGTYRLAHFGRAVRFDPTSHAGAKGLQISHRLLTGSRARARTRDGYWKSPFARFAMQRSQAR